MKIGDNRNKYFAQEDAEKTASYLDQKGKNWFDNLFRNSYLEKVKKSWNGYTGNFYENGHEITYSGEVGELVNLPVNHYRNIAANIVTMMTSTRPSFQAKSVNTDYRSQVQTTLANGLLEYYMREKRLEKYLKTAVEYAVVLGSGYIKMEWNASAGEIYDYIDPEEEHIGSYNQQGEPLDFSGKKLNPFPIYQGDVQFTNLSPYDVVFDSTKEDSLQHDWVLTRSFKNKYDLMAKYPEFEQEIESIPTKTERQKHRISLSPLDDTTDVPVYEFFHKKTESMPQGRYILYLSPSCILMDTAMPYRRLPVYRITAGEILGTPYGYSPMFDLLPLQDAINSLYSTILTNQNAFGVQNILNPRGNDIRVSQVEGGLNFIDYNPVVAGGAPGKPEALNLTQTPAEIFNFIQMLVQNMETISGINSVVRGNPEKSLRSGSSLALVQSQALQFMSGLQQSYIMTIEDVGTGLIELLQDFASVPRIAQIAGVANKPKLKEFSGNDLDSIKRVIVDVGNSLSQSVAGRVQMADNLLQKGLVTNPEDYFSVINNGRLDSMIEGQINQSMLVRAENERLTDGTISVIATQLDKHSLHIRDHMNVLADPDLRLDTELVKRVVGHVQEHIMLLRTTDPATLAIIGEQAIPSMAPPMPPGGQMPPMNQKPEQSGAPTNSAGLPNPPMIQEEQTMPSQIQPLGKPLQG